MSYASQAALARDPEFGARLGSALTTEARAKIDESLGAKIMNSPAWGSTVFMPFVSSAPGFADKFEAGGQGTIQDLEILSAVQASWADVATVQGLGSAA